MKSRSMKSLLVVLLAGGFCFACGPKTPQGPISLQLSYAPQDQLELGTLSGEILNTQFSIGEVTDARDVEPTEIGENVEEKPVAVRTSAASVVATVRDAFLRTFSDAGLRVSEGAPVVLKVHVVKLWVSEDNTYNATARFKVEVWRDGASTGTILVEGTATQFGSSMKGENYREVLSDAMLEAVSRLLGDHGFQQAVAGEGSGNAAGGPQQPETTPAPEAAPEADAATE